MLSFDHQHVNLRQEIQASFSVSGRGSCGVTFAVEPVEDLEYHGIGLLGLYDFISVAKGCPIARGTVSSSLHSRTYASIYGWVQMTNTPGDPWVMDHYPMFEDSTSPFVYWGSEPILVDAPSRLNVENYDWRARSFLCYTPDVGMTKRVVPIMAFEWGFWIKDYKPYVKELRQLKISCWNDHLGVLRGKYPKSTFDRMDVQG